MINLKKTLVVLLFIFLTATYSFSQKSVIPKERTLVNVQNIDKQNLHLYLLIGQSNMAGRGFVEPQDTIACSRILRLNKENEWEIAKDPLHFDKKVAGVGPGMTFAKKMLSACGDSIIIGLIPCAVGGSSIDIWLNDSYYEYTNSTPYSDAINRTKKGMEAGVLKGILWHQGESDCKPEKISSYADKLIELVTKLRKEFSNPNLPFVVGELFEFNKRSVNFNPVLYDVKNKLDYFDVVSGKEMTPNPDNIHIDASSARKLGARYADRFTTLKKNCNVCDDIHTSDSK